MGALAQGKKGVWTVTLFRWRGAGASWTQIGTALGTLFRFWAYRKFVFAGEPL